MSTRNLNRQVQRKVLRLLLDNKPAQFSDNNISHPHLGLSNESHSNDHHSTCNDDDDDDLTSISEFDDMDSLISDSDSNTTNESDDSSVDEPNESSLSFTQELLIFFTLFNLSRTAMEYLLALLRRHGIDAPKSVYLLTKLKGKKFTHVNDMAEGKFAYLSIKDNIMFCLNHGLLLLQNIYSKVENVYSLKIMISIDGLPLYKSSSVSLWPILFKIESVDRPLPIACYCGKGKPPIQLYLENLVEEVKELMNEGLQYAGHLIKLQAPLFVCDAPARSFIQGIKGHAARFGCGYCRCETVREEAHTIFPTCVSELRTTPSYYANLENNQITMSPLREITSLATHFPPEYMHSVCLGIVRKLFNYYFRPIKGLRLRCRVFGKNYSDLNDLIHKYSVYTPREFQRRPRSLQELEHFKATEYRLFLLYLGPFFLKKFLLTEYYEHFLLLHFSIYVFTSPLLNHLNTLAKRCIEIFVNNMPELFKRTSLSYNTHVILHLYDFVSLYGSLDFFSAFPFENYLALLKRRVKKTRGVFQQTLSQLHDIRALNIHSPIQDLFYSNASPNQCAIIDSTVVLIQHVTPEGYIYGIILTFKRPLYTYPYSSQVLSIGYYRETKDNASGFPTRKAIMLPIDSEYLVIPFVA
jgi:hypothetical protein